ncbi:hypothetical protein lerEdw1_017941 [Lerista edwardsae]|nr:hypothetical protein lerEdw1_017941 [Lerista edwardsae]
MDKKSAVRRSGKRRKSQSSGDVPNGDRGTTEHTAKEEPVFDNIPTDLASEKANTPERKVKASQQNYSPTANHDIRAGSNHKGVTKTESEKSRQQPPTSSPYRKKSLKKNQSDTSPLSPTTLKTHGKESSTKRQTEGTADGYPTSKCTSASFGVNTLETSEVITGSSPLSLSEETESKTLLPANSSDGSILLHADKHKNGQMTTNEKPAPDLDSAKQRNTCFDVSRSVTTKVSLPAKPKSIELNLKAPKTLENAENGQDSMDKSVKINFSIANKISMFENKQTNQNQSAEISTSKKGSVSNTFVGRAKLRFGKQPAESEQTNRITNKSSGRQKSLQNGTQMKEGSSGLKTKSEGIIQAGVITNEEDGKVAEAHLTQNGNGNVDDTQVNILPSKKMDAELATDKVLPKTVPLLQHEDIETSQNSINRSINARSISPESGEEFCLNTEICSPSENDQCLVQSGLLPRRLELEHNMMFQVQHEEKNTVLENIQVFEQNISSQQSPSNGYHVPKAGNDDGICDSPSDMEKFTETLKNLDSSVCIPQKKKRPKVPKSPAPHFAMPPIHEDNLEKVYDPNIFTFGLGIKREKPQDLAPSLQLKLQSLETEARVRPKRASTENSILLQSLKSFNRGDPLLIQETAGKEAKDSTDGDVKRSRLENSSIFSSLLSPAVKEKVFMPSVTSVNTITTSFASQKNGNSSVIPPVGFDILQKSEFLSDFKAPDYLEKYLQTDDAKKERSLKIPNFGNLDTNFSSWLKPGQYEANVSPGFLDMELVIHNKSDPSENHVSVFNDVLDCTSWELSPVILVKVIRGCWILYEKPHFEGPSIPLEEGELELTNLWGEEQPSDNKDECKSPVPTVIGSIRHVVKAMKAKQKEPGFIIPPIALLKWVMMWLHILRGGRKVEFPDSPKVIIYEKPFFEGNLIELESELVALAEEGNNKESSELGTEPLTSIGSIKVTGGVWVAYEKPDFEGHQYLLEEGEYQEWKDWGGYDQQVQSLRPILTSFTQPHMIMYADKDFGTKSPSINVLGIISNLKDTGYGLRTQSINVLSGVWVAYENPDFTGEQYILDKGMYPSYEIWGSRNCKISSVQPIVLDNISDHMRKFKVQLFSEPEFQGKSKIFEEDTSQIQDLFTAKSSKVTGSWIAYDKEDFSGNQYVLEEGAYPDLCAMGCLSQTCLKSLQVVNIELSEPVISLFEKENFKGKKIEFTTEIVNLQFLGYSSRIASIQVHGGIYCRERAMIFSQKRVYFRLRNKGTGMFMSTDGNQDDLNLLRIQVAEDAKSDEQVWVYQNGLVKSRVAEDFCLTIVGNLITPGAKLGLALEKNEEKQYWKIQPDGRIYSKMKPNLVLDIKGGKHYDQHHVIVSSVSEDKLTQCWEPLVI